MDGQAVAGGRVAKRKHRVNPLLPKRPKKAITGYGLFLRDYWTQNAPGGGVRASEALRIASLEWNNLSAAQRNRYVQEAQPDRNRYAGEINVWKNQRKALRRPPSAYGLFLQETWKSDAASGRTVGEMGKHVSHLWANMPDEDKEQYRARFRDLTARFSVEKQRVAQGGAINLDWRTGELPDLVVPEIPDEPEDDLDDDSDSEIEDDLLVEED